MWIFYEPKKGNILKYTYMTFRRGIDRDGVVSLKKIIKYIVD